MVLLEEVSRNVKTEVYKTVYLPILLYTSETWIMGDEHKSGVTSSKMKYFRRIEGKTRKAYEMELLEKVLKQTWQQKRQTKNLKWYINAKGKFEKVK